MQTINKKGVLILGFIIFALSLWQPSAALAQWTGTTNISNTNTGYVLVNHDFYTLGNQVTGGTVYNSGLTTTIAGINALDVNAPNLNIVLSLASRTGGNSQLPSMQWQGGGEGFGKWRQYFNQWETGWGLYYNVKFDYEDWDQSGVSGRDADGIAIRNRFDVFEGSQSFWELSFDKEASTDDPPDFGSAANYHMFNGCSADCETDAAGSGPVPAAFDIWGPGNMDAEIRMTATNSVRYALRTMGAGDFRLSSWAPNSPCPCFHQNYTDLFFMDSSGNVKTAGTIAPQNTASKIYSGSGSPNSVVTASIGSIYLRTDGGAGTTFYVKESGSGNTGWAAK